MLILGVIICPKEPFAKVYSHNKKAKLRQVRTQVCDIDGQLCLDIPFHQLRLKHVDACRRTDHHISLLSVLCYFKAASPCPYSWMDDLLTKGLEIVRDVQTTCFPYGINADNEGTEEGKRND